MSFTFFDSHLCQLSDVPKELVKLLKFFLSSKSTAFAAVLQLKALCGCRGDVPTAFTLFTPILQEVDVSTLIYSTALKDHPGLHDDIKGLLLTSTLPNTLCIRQPALDHSS